MRKRLHRYWLALRHQRQLRQALATHLRLLDSPAPFFMGGLTPIEHAQLAELVHRVASVQGPIVEIGTLFGLSTLVLIEASSPDQTVLTIDNYSWNPLGLPPLVHRRFTEAILARDVRAARVRIIDSDSCHFMMHYQGPSPAIVFLDGDHTFAAVEREIDWAKRAGASLICGHDFSLTHPGVMRAVTAAFAGQFELCETLWWWSKSGSAFQEL